MRPTLSQYEHIIEELSKDIREKIIFTDTKRFPVGIAIVKQIVHGQVIYYVDRHDREDEAISSILHVRLKALLTIKHVLQFYMSSATITSKNIEKYSLDFYYDDFSHSINTQLSKKLIAELGKYINL